MRQRNHRQGRGQGRGPRQGPKGDRVKGTFFKLLKDEDASMRSSMDATRFVQGMVSFDSTAELLGLLDDGRNFGSMRIKQILTFIEGVHEVNEILIPTLSCIINEETNRPLYRRPRNRLIAIMNGVPGLYSLLNEPDLLAMIPVYSAKVIVTFLETAAMTLLEARVNDDVKRLAISLKVRQIEGAEKLCSLLLLEEQKPGRESTGRYSKAGDGDNVACWVSDMVEPGERHDNDFKNFRDIQLVPTQAEMSCETSPWLPLASQENAFIDNKEMRFLDTSFRLLREDAVSTMKSNIAEEKKVWKNARLIGMNPGFEDGKRGVQPLSFLVQLDSSYAGKKINWERSRMLPHEGVIALCDTTDKSIKRLGTITIRNFKEKGRWLHHPRGPVIGITFHNSDDIYTSIQEVIDSASILAKAGLNDIHKNAHALSDDKRGEWKGLESSFISYNLVEASDSFFSYRPVLEALQDFSSVPLSKELVHLEPSCQRPLYIPSKVKMPNTESFGGFTYDLDNWSCAEVITRTSLDESQAEAVHHALTSRVALIQGPPGTGKTFLGSLIAQMIRDNTDESILCVCYTNHALDQFLEHLCDNGEERIVRIGGRSKSEKLKRFNLRELAKAKAPLHSDSKRRMGAVFAKLYACHERIEELTEEFGQAIKWDIPNGGIASLLEEENTLLYRHFNTADELSDGFDIVGRDNKKISSGSMFDMWVKGASCPGYLIPYIELEDDENKNIILNFWALSTDDRNELLREWRMSLFESTYESFKDEVIMFEELRAEKDAINREQDLYILRDARVIGATTNGAAKYRDILGEKSPGVVIVEEAGEVLEPHILSSLSEGKGGEHETKHLILIGDHLQLRPKIESYKLSAASRSGYNFDFSLFERMVRSNFPSTMLKVQHRMRPYISEFIRSQTYPALVDHISTLAFENVKGVTNNVVFVHHENKERGGDASSGESKTKSNDEEALMCVEIVRYLLLQGYRHDQITILTPYVGQVLKLIKALQSRLRDVSAYVGELDQQEIIDNVLTSQDEENENLLGSDSPKAIRCSSIDNFQGEESDIIVVSLVRSNARGDIGFLKEEQRVNVLLSRARIGLYMVGNAKTFTQSTKGGHVWNPILERLEKDKSVLEGFPTVCQLHPEDAAININKPELFRELCPNGGCTRPCDSRLECGHACPMACHPTDRKHLIAHKKCTEQCRRIPPDCALNHPCTKFCNQDCGRCEIKVAPTKLSCGHTLANPKCFEVRNEEAIFERSKKCSESVEYTFPECDHKCFTTCSNSKRVAPICPAICNKVMDCQHRCTNSCSKCKGNHSCKKFCERILLCGHMCNENCHGNSPCPPCKNKCCNRCIHSTCDKKCSSKCSSCTHDCDWQCEHKGRCPLVCGAPCVRMPCNKRCTKKLSCGHQCPSVCGEVCPQSKYCQICCGADKSSHIVDLIEFSNYADANIDEDPIVVLPCGHHYNITTLDGVFGMSQAYTINPNGDFVDVKPLLRSDDVKPKCCPDCRVVVHSVGRYGRLLNFLRLRFLERKHTMAIGRSLKACAYKLSQDEIDDKGLATIEKKLHGILKEIKNGPTQLVYDACGGNTQVEVPSPPSNTIVQALQLTGKTYSRLIKESKDGNYERAVQAYAEVIEICDDTFSFRLGAEIRLSLAKLYMRWCNVKEMEKELELLLDPILAKEDSPVFSSLVKETKALKEQISTGALEEVFEAMNVIDGYDYGGSWSAHWYECPNGHPYFIGECGMAMQQSRCMECGETVGGGQHRLHNTNRQSETVRRIIDRS